jgi:HSP20 family protein
MNNLKPLVSRNLFDELFRDVNPGYFVKPLHGDTLPSPIKVDVKEVADAFILEAEIPGVAKENIDVDIDNKIVTIRAYISQIDGQKGEEHKVLRTERYYGEVSRSFQLSTEIDKDSSKARYEQGILTLTLNKKQKTVNQRLIIE